MRADAAQYGVDVSRVGLWGGSAGGNLAAMVATSAAGQRLVSAVVSWSGIYDLPRLVAHPDRNFRRWVESYLTCSPSACPAEAEDASPITHVGAADPPMLLSASELEGTGCRHPSGGACEEPEYPGVPEDQAAEMANALQAEGVVNDLIVLPGHEHSRDYVNLAMSRTVASSNPSSV